CSSGIDLAVQMCLRPRPAKIRQDHMAPTAALLKPDQPMRYEPFPLGLSQLRPCVLQWQLSPTERHAEHEKHLRRCGLKTHREALESENVYFALIMSYAQSYQKNAGVGPW